MKICKKIVFMLSIISRIALADNTNSNLQINTTLAPSCAINTNTLDFGTFSPGTGFITGSVNILSVCTKGTSYSISALGTPTRSLVGIQTGNTDKFTYALYTNSSLTNVFGDGTSGTAMISGTGTSAVVTNTIYGRLITNKYNLPDIYSDILTINLNY